MDKIGIKLANSEFYPILDHGRPARKRLVVTTVNDGQRSAQIDLYRGDGPMVTDAVYVGSLVVEDIPEGKAGEPDVRLDLELDEADMLKCTAVEAESGATQSIRVSLEALGEENSYEIPDFDLGADEEAPEEASEEAFDEETDTLPEEATSPEGGAGLLSTAEEILDGRAKRSLLPWIIAAIVLVLALVTLGWLFFFRSANGPGSTEAGMTTGQSASSSAQAPSVQPLPETQAASADSAQAIAATAAAVTAPAATAPSQPASVATTQTATAQTPTAQSKPTVTTPAPKAAPKATGKRYRLKWGDTLWDLAWVYYRDPWLYPRIAKANGIRNPDFILSGTWILIPTR